MGEIMHVFKSVRFMEYAYCDSTQLTPCYSQDQTREEWKLIWLGQIESTLVDEKFIEHGGEISDYFQEPLSQAMQIKRMHSLLQKG